MSRTALLAGATGLVGSHVLDLLLADDEWTHVVTLGRRTAPIRHDKLEQRILDLGRRRFDESITTSSSGWRAQACARARSSSCWSVRSAPIPNPASFTAA